ncbi:MAG: GntR family transcriptional regulator [Vicinamibacterales bacterium]
MTQKVPSASLAATAYSAVRRRILRGELTLGQAISRRKLAAELGISFPPVTEALLRLELEGLLESRPRAGTRVRIPSRDDVFGHYVVREALEAQAAVLCAERATRIERRELRKLAERVDILAAREDRSTYVAQHLKLHRRIADCARCEPLTTAVERTQALASIWFCLMRKPSPQDSTSRHQELVEAILGGNVAQVTAAVKEHLAVGRQRTLEVLEPYFRLRKSRGARFHRTDKNLGALPVVGVRH